MRCKYVVRQCDQNGAVNVLYPVSFVEAWRVMNPHFSTTTQMTVTDTVDDSVLAYVARERMTEEMRKTLQKTDADHLAGVLNGQFYYRTVTDQYRFMTAQECWDLICDIEASKSGRK